MAKEVKVKAVGEFNGQSTKPNKSIDLSFKFPYSELVNSVQTLQMLNENITVSAKIGDEKPIKLGMFTLNGLNFDRDGEAVLKLNSMLDYVEADNLNTIAALGKGEQFHILFKASVEEEGEE
jgi:hypothetical protein